MKKWIFILVLILILIPVLAFAAGLRVDFKVLAEKMQKKPDHNAEALRKMGIDPSRIEFKGKPWWTLNPEDNLFKRVKGWDPIKQMSDESWNTSQEMKKKLGVSEDLMAQAAAAQAQRNQQAMEQHIREMQQ